MVELKNHADIRVWGDKEDKKEMYRRIERDENVRVRRILAESVDPPLILNVVIGLINALKIIHDFLKERKSKNIDIQISLRDGRVVSVKSTNPDKLQVLIRELAEEKLKSASP